MFRVNESQRYEQCINDFCKTYANSFKGIVEYDDLVQVANLQLLEDLNTSAGEIRFSKELININSALLRYIDEQGTYYNKKVSYSNAILISFGFENFVERNTMLKEVCAGLSSEQVELFSLTVEKDLTFTEIAKLKGVSSEKVKRDLYYAFSCFIAESLRRGIIRAEWNL